MVRKKSGFLIIAIFFVMALAGVIFLLKKEPPVIVSRNEIKAVSTIEYPSKFNYRQTINDCGPYNTSAVIRALKGEEADPQIFAKEMKWRLPNKYTLPWGLESQLRKNGIAIETPRMSSLTNEDKITFLKQELSRKKPVIILGGRERYQHYLTLFGFNSETDAFYVYDSFFEKDPSAQGLSKDNNSDLPGNTTLTTNELLDFWSKGGMYGFYKWYAIATSVKST